MSNWKDAPHFLIHKGESNFTSDKEFLNNDSDEFYDTVSTSHVISNEWDETDYLKVADYNKIDSLNLVIKHNEEKFLKREEYYRDKHDKLKDVVGILTQENYEAKRNIDRAFELLKYHGCSMAAQSCSECEFIEEIEGKL